MGKYQSTLELRMRSIEGLFVAPQPDPLSVDYQTRSGVNQMLDALSAEWPPLNAQIQIKLILPEVHSASASEETARSAVMRYCDNQIRCMRGQITAVHREGRRALRIGLIFLSVCLALSTFFSQIDQLPTFLQRVLVEGLSIAGWVALWRPLELLLYEWWPQRRRVRLFSMIRNAKWQVVEERHYEPMPLHTDAQSLR